MVEDMPIIAVNSFGVITSLWAIIMFLIFASEDNRSSAELQTVLHMIGLFTFLLLNHLEIISSLILSLVACASSIMMYAVPLASMQKILRTRSHEGALSPRLIGITLIVCFTWLIYGVRNGNWFVIIPNLIGTSIALLQSGLLIWCGRPAKSFNGVYENLPLASVVLSST